jgi:MFS family permease
MKGAITRTVWILSLVSLFTDAASEMLYTVMPLYLQSIGFTVLLIGILEGIAEATAGVSKGYFGRQSDITGKRTPFVQWGYALSALAKPLTIAFAAPLWIFFTRTLDRLGKGLRTAARDALLSDEATVSTKGKVFGFHRSMDTLGAVIGPLLALLYLHYHPKNYTTLFLIAIVPGLAATACSLLLKDKKRISIPQKQPAGILSFMAYWKKSPVAYRRLTLGLLFFTLFNSSDVFLLLKAKQAGRSDSDVLMLYIFYNLIYALAAFPAGMLADKIGLKNVFIAGLVFFAATYTGMAFTTSIHLIYGLFFVYGLYAACTEGVAKAWITNVAAKEDTATAIGNFVAFQSLCTMLASTLAGIAWYRFGATALFMLTGLAAAISAVYFILAFRHNKPH